MKKIVKLCIFITFLYVIAVMFLSFFIMRKPDGNLTYDFNEAEVLSTNAQNFVSHNNESVHLELPVQNTVDLNQCFFDVDISEGGTFCIGEINENGYFEEDKKYNFRYKDGISYMISFNVLDLKNQSIDFLNIDDKNNYDIEGYVVGSNTDTIKYKRQYNKDELKNTLDISDNCHLYISGKSAFFKLNNFVVYKLKELTEDESEVSDVYEFNESAKYLKLSSYKMKYYVCSQKQETIPYNCIFPSVVLPANRISLHGLKDFHVGSSSGNLMYNFEDKQKIYTLKSKQFDMKNAGKVSELIVREMNFSNRYENNGYLFVDNANVLVDGKDASFFRFRHFFTKKNILVSFLIYISFLLVSSVVVCLMNRKVNNRINNKNNRIKKKRRIKIKKGHIGLLLTGITIVVYIFGNHYSKKNNDIQYMLNLPSFNLDISKDDKDNKLCHIRNEGGRIKEATLIPHMYLSTTNYKINSHYSIEIKDFFGEKMLTEDIYLYSAKQVFDTKNNGWDVCIDRKKEAEGLSFLKEIGEKIVSSNLLYSLDLCFEIEYVDFADKKHTEWYFANYDEGILHCLNENYHTPLDVYTTDRNINLDSLNYSQRDAIIQQLAEEFERNLLLVNEKMPE